MCKHQSFALHAENDGGAVMVQTLQAWAGIIESAVDASQKWNQLSSHQQQVVMQEYNLLLAKMEGLC